MAEKSESIVLDSSRSTQISLEAIREGNAGLNAHRQALRIIGQKRSVVVSGRTGRMKEFGQSPFEDYGL